MEDCIGWLATINYPGPTSPGDRPPGWDPAGPDASLTAVDLQAYRCNRISVGAFERGPVHLMFEGHTNAAWPPKCLEHPADQLSFLKVGTQIWIDDAEIASYLRSEYGAPMVVGQFNESDQDLSVGRSHTWTWTAGGQPSEITLLDDGSANKIDSLFERYFWANGTAGLVQLDFTPDDTGNSPGQRTGYGTMHAPTQFANDTGGVFSGLTRWYSEHSASAAFTVYADLRCEQTVP